MSARGKFAEWVGDGLAKLGRKLSGKTDDAVHAAAHGADDAAHAGTGAARREPGLEPTQPNRADFQDATPSSSHLDLPIGEGILKPSQKLVSKEYGKYVADGFTKLNQHVAGGDKVSLLARQSEFADALREQGTLIQHRVFRNELTNPKAVEARLRVGKEVTESEFQHLAEFQLRKQAHGPKYSEAQILKDMSAEQTMMKSGLLSMRDRAMSLVLRDPVPGLRGSLTPRFLGSAALAGAAASMGVGLYNDLDNPSTFNAAGRIADSATGWLAPNANVDGKELGIGLWADLKFRASTLRNTEKMKSLGTAVESGKADPVNAYYYLSTRQQPVEAEARRAKLHEQEAEVKAQSAALSTQTAQETVQQQARAAREARVDPKPAQVYADQLAKDLGMVPANPPPPPLPRPEPTRN